MISNPPERKDPKKTEGVQCFTITVVPGSHPNTLPVETMLYIMPGDYGMLIRVPGTLLR